MNNKRPVCPVVSDLKVEFGYTILNQIRNLGYKISKKNFTTIWALGLTQEERRKKKTIIEWDIQNIE